MITCKKIRTEYLYCRGDTVYDTFDTYEEAKKELVKDDKNPMEDVVDSIGGKLHIIKRVYYECSD